jgi:hypothetical protein
MEAALDTSPSESICMSMIYLLAPVVIYTHLFCMRLTFLSEYAENGDSDGVIIAEGYVLEFDNVSVKKLESIPKRC